MRAIAGQARQEAGDRHTRRSAIILNVTAARKR
jgi:hypothetical protein